MGNQSSNQNTICDTCHNLQSFNQLTEKFNGKPLNFSSTYSQLNIGNRVGHSNYVDFLTFDEVTEPVMTGIDVFQRPFMVIKIDVFDHNDNFKKRLMETFFQRYTDDKYLWMGCGHATNNLISTIGGMKPCQFHLINDLLDNKYVKILECHIPDTGTDVGDKVRLSTTSECSEFVNIPLTEEASNHEPVTEEKQVTKEVNDEVHVTES